MLVRVRVLTDHTLAASSPSGCHVVVREEAAAAGLGAADGPPPEKLCLTDKEKHCLFVFIFREK